MVVVCIIMEAERRTDRKMVGYLRNNPDVAVKIGLQRIPSKSTIARAHDLIPDRYLMGMHRMVIGDMAVGPVAGDSPGYSDSRFVR